MRATRSYAKKSNVVQKSKNKAVSVRKQAAGEGKSSASNQAVLNSSWNEDEFVLRLSDESDIRPNESTVAKSTLRRRVWFSDPITLSENKKVSLRTHPSGASFSACLNKPGNLLKSAQCMTAKVVLEKLSELSLRRWIKPQKKLSIERKVNSDDDFSKRTKRYCLKCTRIVHNTSSKDEEPCGKCNTFLLYHCVKCGEKKMTHLAIRRHLHVKCSNSRRSRANTADKGR